MLFTADDGISNAGTGRCRSESAFDCNRSLWLYAWGKRRPFIGFCCGLLVDCVFGDVVGLYAFIYMIVGYLNGLVNKVYYSDDIVVPVILVAASDFIYNFFYYMFEFLLRSRLDFFFYLRRIILPELIYTVLVSVVLYKLLHTINSWLERMEQREA